MDPKPGTMQPFVPATTPEPAPSPTPVVESPAVTEPEVEEATPDASD
mgnify:CR=1 FL=1